MKMNVFLVVGYQRNLVSTALSLVSNPKNYFREICVQTNILISLSLSLYVQRDILLKLHPGMKAFI